ncbi:MAG: histidine phosphatase family protein [Rhodospirillales bacterium]|nr:histidine phosphatase family protein [Alphaproteobacteria bacterium]MCB9986106.1 histidine phosphatase family protein [Rhodospirillales bacterium]USO07333.1 MAG: histidine phosphatase family protein [Rhodospirillales bacterium]
MLPARPFFLIRHGETVMNAKRLFCGGGVDTELNAEGRRQAFDVTKVLDAMPAHQRPTLIVHSDMVRTRQTTEILNSSLNLPVMADHDLREQMMGEWEKLPWSETLPLLHSGAKPKGGESRAEFGARVRTAFIRVLSNHAGERILIVGHGGTFHALQLIHGVDRRVFIPNATLHRFAPEPAHAPMPWRITYYRWKNALREDTAPICPSADAARTIYG